MQQMRGQGVDIAPFFEAKSVALIGASERPGSLGTVLMENLTEAEFGGPIYPVNARHPKIAGHRAYASVRDIGEPVDLAIVVTPAKTVPQILEDCGASGVRAAVILSAGFRETGPEGRDLEADVVSVARRHGIRFIGPNCLGVMRPDIGLNATFSRGMAHPGRIALVSQSGAMCTAMLDWAEPRNVGFSCVISSGIAADVDFGEILDYLVFDPATRAIMLYIEGIHDARRFMSALRAASRVKPVIVMKGGRYREGSRAAVSHTGALVGSDDVFDAALSRAGAVRVNDYSHFFAVAETLHTGLKTKGPKLAIVTNGGGPGVIAADALGDHRLSLAPLADETVAELDRALPRVWSGGNPVDVIGDASAERYAAAVRACLEDPGVDSVLSIFVPVGLTEPLDVARAVSKIAADIRKPLLTCWMGDISMRTSREHLRDAGIPTFATPEAAIESFAAAAAHRANQKLLLEVPEPVSFETDTDRAGAEAIIENALASGREVLDVVESKAILAAFGIPVVRSMPAHDAAEATAIAEEIGLPIAMKIHSRDITHKSDVDGVRLGISSGAEVRKAFNEIVDTARSINPDADIIGVTIEPMWKPRAGRELMLGVINDEAFGPAISVGLGGTMVEVIGDRAVGLPPLNRYLVRKLIDDTRAATYLQPYRGRPAANRNAVEKVILRLSDMVGQLPWIAELDINPLIVDETEARAIDARIAVRRVSPAANSYAHMAIHPYPVDLVDELVLSDGTSLTVRPIRPEDAVIEREFVNGLSDRSRYLRFMASLKEITPEMLSRFTQIDYDREMALIAVLPGEDNDRQIAVARYIMYPDGRGCEFGIVVGDDWHHKGIATYLLQRLIDIARDRRLERMDGIVLRENRGMLKLAEDLGFTSHRVPEDPQLVRVSLNL